MSGDADFDIRAAWLRRFRSDTESNLKAFALRLKEALPDSVTIQESKGFFSRAARTVGVSVDLGEKRYTLALDGARLTATVAMIVRGITLNTKTLDPAEWFAHLNEETRAATDHARALSESLTRFMET